MVRPATPQDLTAVHAIARANPTAPQWSKEQFADILQSHVGLAVERTLLVAEDVGSVTGFAVVSALTSVYPVQAELESIAVDPTTQRQGIGRLLLEAVFDWCTRKSVTELHLEVRVSNTNAISLYEQAGFKAEGFRPGYYEAPKEDAMCMMCNTFSSGNPLSTVINSR